MPKLLGTRNRTKRPPHVGPMFPPGLALCWLSRGPPKVRNQEAGIHLIPVSLLVGKITRDDDVIGTKSGFRISLLPLD